MADKQPLLLHNKPVAVLPCAVGLLIALQILMLQIYASVGYKFPMHPTITLLPGWTIFARAALFLAQIDNRGLKEKRNLMKGKAANNEIPAMTNQMLELESLANRIFSFKILLFSVVWLVANIAMEFRRENIPFWIVSFLAVLIFVGLSIEGFNRNIMWWEDSRQETRNALVTSDDEEDEDEQDGTGV